MNMVSMGVFNFSLVSLSLENINMSSKYGCVRLQCSFPVTGEHEHGE